MTTTASAGIDQQIELLCKGCVDVIRVDDLRQRLVSAAHEQRPLTVKVGFDPSAPDLHLGHTVVIRKMRHFQQLGHRVVFLIGDFTGMIGDPTGKKSTRPQLTQEQVQANAETYKRQIFKLLDRHATVIDFNARWLGALSSEEWIRLTARVTLAQILERDDFSKRLQAGEPISLHELLYPVAQAYDSVFLKADVELGGTDQLFNLLVGRDLMGKLGLQPQIVMTLPLLEGLDGVEKMSKSLGNYVAVEDPPEEMFGKLMSISDTLMWKYWTLLTDWDPSSVRALQKSVSNGERHPMDAKIDLARAITGDFWGEEAARAAEEHFRAVHQKREIPEQIRKIDIVVTESTTVLVKLLPLGALAESNAAARRLIEQGAVKIDGQVIREPLAVVPTAPGTSTLMQVGKRHFVRLTFVSG